jgi:hypothetical protein
MGLVVLRDPRQAARAVRGTLGLNASCPSFSSQFEILRATVWSMAAPAGEVHVNRVLSAALPTWRLLSERSTASEEALRAELRAALSTLEDAGDLLRLSGGYWCPATARLVEFPAGAGHLLIGGVPSSLLPIDSATVEYHGPHRHLAKPSPELSAALPVEEFASWSRMPNVSLQEWAREAIDSFERLPYSPTSAEAFEFYLPASSRPGTPQFKRWSDSAGNTTGTLLARRMRLYGAREYRLVDVRVGRVVGACDLHGFDVRRLMYALDLAAKNAVRARRLHAGDQAEWLFTSELPRAEQRTFAAFGTLTIPDARPFERRWVFTRNEELALSMLRDLGMTLEQPNREDRR